MKRRVEKLEKLSARGELGIYLLTPTEDGNYTYWNEDKDGTFTPKEVDKLKENTNNHVLIIKWVDSEEN